MTAGATPRSSSRHPAGAGGSPRDDGPRCRPLAGRRPRLRVRRARPVWPLPGRPERRLLPEARHRIERRLTSRRAAPRGRVSRATRARAAVGGSAAAPRSRATSSSTSRPRARSIGRSCARACRFATSSSTRSCGCTRSRSSGRRSRSPAATSPGCSRRWSASGGSTASDADLEVIRALQPALEAGDYAVTVAVHDRRTITAVWPGLHDRAPRRRPRHRVDDDRRPPRESRRRRGPRLDGVMNPQIRFGEDLMSRVSYAMLHEGGAGAMTRAVRDAIARARSPGWPRGPASRVKEILELVHRGQPDHASPRCWASIRCRSARRRSRSRPTRPVARAAERARPAGAHRRARLRPAVHRGPRRCRRRRP